MSATLQKPIEMPTASPRAVSPFFWCLRRELWENRFISIAPAAVAVLVVAAYFVGTVHIAQIMQSNPRAASATPPQGLPFYIGNASVLLSATLAGVFYALGALYNERRDRSILFWKSLPISDTTAVLAKAFIPFVVLPIVSFILTLAVELAMLGLARGFAAGHGAVPGFWTNWPFFRMALVMFYCFATLVLWQAPLWGWLFLVSAWAKRAPFLWAFLLPLGLCVGEKVAFDSSLFCGMIINRMGGAMDAGFNALNGYSGLISPNQIAPLKFLGAPDLWIGLGVAAGFFIAAIRLRRLRGPI